MSNFPGYAIAVEMNAGHPTAANLLDHSCALRLLAVTCRIGQPSRRLQLAEIVGPGMSTEERLRRETGDVFVADPRLARFVHVAIEEKIENDRQPGPFDFRIMYTLIKDNGGEIVLTLACLMLASQSPLTFDILLESADKKRENEGKRIFSSLCEALEITEIEDSSSLHGCVASTHFEKDAYTRRQVRRFTPVAGALN